MKYIWPILIVFLFSACNQGEEAEGGENEAKEDNFSIEGIVDGAPNTKFYIEAKDQKGSYVISEVTSDGNGSFTLNGHIDEIGLYQFRKGEDYENTLLLTLVPGDHLTIKTTNDQFSTEPHASGTDWAETMNLYMKEVTDFRDSYYELQSNPDLTPGEIGAAFDNLKERIDHFAISEMKKDLDNPYNVVLTTYAVPAGDYANWDSSNLELLKKIADAFVKAYPNAAVTSTMSEQVWQIERSYDDYLANSSGTRPAPEIALKDPNGKEIRLSSLRGKYVLIDFWASWCGPCRRESPNVVKLYNKYKDKGFTVYSVSLDNDAGKWKEAIEKDGLVWPNHVSDLLQWKSPMPQLYGFSSIPHTVLVNKEGMIIGTGLRGNALEQKLKEIFEK